MSLELAREIIQLKLPSETLFAWREGMSDWTPIEKIDELRAKPEAVPGDWTQAIPKVALAPSDRTDALDPAIIRKARSQARWFGFSRRFAKNWRTIAGVVLLLMGIAAVWIFATQEDARKWLVSSERSTH